MKQTAHCAACAAVVIAIGGGCAKNNPPAQNASSGQRTDIPAYYLTGAGTSVDNTENEEAETWDNPDTDDETESEARSRDEADDTSLSGGDSEQPEPEEAWQRGGDTRQGLEDPEPEPDTDFLE